MSPARSPARMLAGLLSLLSDWRPQELQLAIRLAIADSAVQPGSVADALRVELNSQKSADDVRALFDRLLTHSDVVRRSAEAIQRPRRPPPRPIVEIKVDETQPSRPRSQQLFKRLPDQQLEDSAALESKRPRPVMPRIAPLKPLTTLTQPQTTQLVTLTNLSSATNSTGTLADSRISSQIVNGGSTSTVKIIRLCEAPSSSSSTSPSSSHRLQPAAPRRPLQPPVAPQVQTHYSTEQIQFEDAGHLKITLRPLGARPPISGPGAQVGQSPATPSLTLLPNGLSAGGGGSSGGISFGSLTSGEVQPTGLQLPLLVEPNDADHPILID